MNWIDKTINYISPTWGLKRIRDRSIVYTIVNSGYSQSGASKRKNSLRGWTASSKSPAEDINDNLHTLRQRSRSLYMGGGLGTAAIKVMRSNIVGSGLKLKPNIDYESLGLTRDEGRKWCKEVEREFGVWATSKDCDYLGLNNFYELQSMALLGVLLNGDAIALVNYSDITSDYDLKLHLVESDRLSNPDGSLSVSLTKEGNKIISGIEVNNRGKPIAYWISNNHPQVRFNYNNPLKWERIKAINDYTGFPNVLFSFNAERAGQYRGVPFLSPIIELIKSMERYTEAEVTAAIINSFYSVFIENVGDPTTMSFQRSILDGDSVLTAEERAENYELGAGTINVLGSGEKVVFSDPKRPTSSFESFSNQITKLIGSTLEIPYEVLVKSFNSSYSASRAALLEAWRLFRLKREWFINDFCQPVYEMWLFEAISKGKIKAKGYFESKSKIKLWSSATWIGTAQGQIDPVKEVQAAKLRIENGFSTREKEAQELTGMDFESNLRVLERENQGLYTVNNVKEGK